MLVEGVPDDQWLNEPDSWTADDGALVMTTRPGSDFWRTTHHGFVRDSGHFLGRRVCGDFVVRAVVGGEYRDQYDQAGLMVRLDAERWVKTGIELVDGFQQMSAVVTHAVSDWSITPVDAPELLALRVTRRGDALSIEYGPHDGPLRLHRIAFFPAELPVQVGPMAASPDGGGFTAHFMGWHVDPL